MKVSLDIGVSPGASSRLWQGLPRARPIARETIAAAIAECDGALPIARPEGRAPSQTPYRVAVSLCLADDATLCALNARWRGIDKPTNVLSFPAASRAGGEAPTLGDIALAFETLEHEAAALAIPLADHYRHLLAHGFLHLIGYDHETTREAERMEALETRILARLGAADPYARLKVGG